MFDMMTVVHVKKRDELIVDLATIITRCVHYFKEFIYPQLLMINGMSRAHHEFYDVVGCIVHHLIVMNWMRWTRFKPCS